MIGLTSLQRDTVMRGVASFDGEVLLFGSRLHGTPRPDSDLDLCLKARVGRVTLAELSRLREYFENSHLPFQVDLVDYADLNATFRSLVDREGKNFLRMPK